MKAPAGTTWQRLALLRQLTLPTIHRISTASRWHRPRAPDLGQAWAVLRQGARAFPAGARRPLLAIATDLALFVAALMAVLLAASLGPRLYGYSPVIVYGGSMADTIRVGSIAVTKEIRAEDVAVGDVIVFRPPDTAPDRLPVMHRVVSIREEDGQRIFRTKGDANAAPDPWEMYIQGRGARVVYSVPYVGYLVNFAKTPLGCTLLLLLPVGYLGLTTLRRIWARGVQPARTAP